MRRPGLRWLGAVGLALFAAPTAFAIGFAVSINYYRWLWNVPAPPPGGHGELSFLSRPVALEAIWQSLLLTILWLGGWWLLYVRRAEPPLWFNRRALTVLALFAVFSGGVTAWMMSTYPGSRL